MANKKQKSIIRLEPHPQMVNSLIQEIVQTGGLKVIGLGVFKLEKKKTTGFNPFTQKRQDFPAYTKVHFTPTKELKLTIQKWK